MNILIIGGTGNISWWVTKQAVEKGDNVTILHRDMNGSFRRRENISGAKEWVANINTVAEIGDTYDVVIDFVCYTKEQAKQRIKLFTDKCAQYIFISSAAVYDRDNSPLPYKNDSYRHSEWDYAANKIACEMEFISAHFIDGFPVTIIRPGHIFDTVFPAAVGSNDWTVPQRMIDGKIVVLPGDGTGVWSLMHSFDFAKNLYPFFLNMSTIGGNGYHIASRNLYTWRRLYSLIAQAIGVKKVNILCLPSKIIYNESNYWGNGIIYHKRYPEIYDLTETLNVSLNEYSDPLFEDRIGITVDWYKQDERRMVVNPAADKFLDLLNSKYNGIR